MQSAPMLQTDLHQNHRRLTLPRQVVLQVIRRASRHLTPAEIYSRAKVRHSPLGLATVYRSLDLLVELGYVQRIHLEQGCHSYAPSERQHGHHLVCSNCGRAEEFADCDLEPLIKTLQSKTGYKINVHMLELMGRCPSCQPKSNFAPVRDRTKSARRK